MSEDLPPEGPDLSGLLDVPPSPPSPDGDGLRKIIARARRRTGAAAAAVVAVVLVAGGAGGYLLAPGRGPAAVTRGVASGGSVATPGTRAVNPATGSVGGNPGGGASLACPLAGTGATSGGGATTPVLPRCLPGPPMAGTYLHLFTRTTTGAVTVRGYVDPCPSCYHAVPFQVVEVSTAAVATTVNAALPPAGKAPLGEASGRVVGKPEQSPLAVVSVAAGDGVATVRLSVGGAVDSMAPVDGFAALAVPVSEAVAASRTATATVEALSPAGRVLAVTQVALGVGPVPYASGGAPAVTRG